MNQNQVIGIGVGVVALIVLAIGGSMWAMSPGSDVVVRPEKPIAALEAGEGGAATPAARAQRQMSQGGARAALKAKVQNMDPEQRAELKAKLQARRTNRQAAAGKAKGASSTAKRRPGGALEGVNARLDAFANTAGWDTDTTEEVRSLLEETHQHITESVAAAKSGTGDREAMKAELATYREEQAQLVKEAVGADQFDAFVAAMGMQRFFSAAAGEAGTP